MRKLILTAAIVCASVMSYGAACTWSIVNVQSPAGGTANAGWIVQVFDSSTVYDYQDAKNGSISALFTGATAAVGTTTTVKAGAKEGNFAAESSGSLYAVIYDSSTVAGASHYIVSENVAYSVNALGKDFTVAFGNMTGTTTANHFLSSTWQATSSIPEPTSGVLLLLGIAGLALRRKQG